MKGQFRDLQADCWASAEGARSPVGSRLNRKRMRPLFLAVFGCQRANVEALSLIARRISARIFGRAPLRHADSGPSAPPPQCFARTTALRSGNFGLPVLV